MTVHWHWSLPCGNAKGTPPQRRLVNNHSCLKSVHVARNVTSGYYRNHYLLELAYSFTPGSNCCSKQFNAFRLIRVANSTLSNELIINQFASYVHIKKKNYLLYIYISHACHLSVLSSSHTYCISLFFCVAFFHFLPLSTLLRYLSLTHTLYLSLTK